MAGHRQLAPAAAFARIRLNLKLRVPGRPLHTTMETRSRDDESLIGVVRPAPTIEMRPWSAGRSNCNPKIGSKGAAPPPKVKDDSP